MTHEAEPGAEPTGGAQHNQALPNAWEVPREREPDALAPVLHREHWDGPVPGGMLDAERDLPVEHRPSTLRAQAGG